MASIISASRRLGLVAASAGGRGVHRMSTSAAETPVYQFKTLLVTRPSAHILRVELNRPKKSNAMNRDFWREIRECFAAISDDSDCRAVVLTGAGKNFTAGLDLVDAGQDIFGIETSDAARRAFALRKVIVAYQESFSAIERCPKPVIAAIHGACVGGGIDMVSACCVRLASSDAWFQIKEVDIGLAADVGTLQRLPKIVGNDSLVRELSYTARKFDAAEAKQMGFISRISGDTQESVVQDALAMAGEIAKRSPVAITGTKVNLNYARDHPTANALDYMANWNMAMLQTDDIMQCMQASMSKTEPVFSKL
eukprot:Opistho-2@85783